MAGISLDVLRAGKKYKLINYGERFDFTIEEILSNGDFKIKDIHTLEVGQLIDLYKYGKGKDFEIREL